MMLITDTAADGVPVGGGVTTSGIALLFDRPVVGSLTVIVGLLPRSLAVPVQVSSPEAGTVAGVQSVPGIDTLSPGVPPVQFTVTVALAAAGFGLAVQAGTTVACGAIESGIVPVLVLPVVGSVTVIGGLLLRPLAGPVQVSSPVAGTVAGSQLVPGIVTVVPGCAF
jgi:hypothetical protein